MIEKRTYLTLLFDFYSSLLTEKQRLFFELYYYNDLSLGEIAEQYQVSRTAIYDNIKRVESLLIDYEAKLIMVSKYQKTNEKLMDTLEIINGLEDNDTNPNLKKLKQLLLTLVEINES